MPRLRTESIETAQDRLLDASETDEKNTSQVGWADRQHSASEAGKLDRARGATRHRALLEDSMRSSADSARNLVRWTVIAFAALVLLSWAVAQVLPPNDLDPGVPSTWFLSAAGWGVMTMFIVNFVKTNVVQVRGLATIGLAGAIAVGGSLIAGTGLLAGAGIVLEGNLAELISFGLTAFVTSAGSWDTAKNLRALPSGITAVVDVSTAPTAQKAADSVVAKARGRL